MARSSRDIFVEENNWDVRFSGNWTHERGRMFHAGGLMRTEEVGASVAITFWGTGIKLLGSLGWNHSQLAITLDGGNMTIFDAYCCPPTGSVVQVVQFSVSGLGRGAHTLNVTNVMAGPHGTVLDVDAFIVTRQPVDILALSVAGALVLLFMFWMVWVRRKEMYPFLSHWASPWRKLKTDSEAQNAYQMVPTSISTEDLASSDETARCIIGDDEQSEEDSVVGGLRESKPFGKPRLIPDLVEL